MSGPAMLLQQAARHARFAAAGGWPDVLTIGELAALQYPHDDTPEGKKRARLQQRDFYAMVSNAVKASELTAEVVRRVKTVYQQALEYRASRDPWVSAFGSDEWTGRDFGGRHRPRTVLMPVQETIEVQAVRPATVAPWLGTIGEQPSRYVAAWFEAKGAAHEKGNGEVAKETPQERRARLRARCKQLKTEGVRGWQVQTASEENISTARLKALLADDTGTPNTKFGRLASFKASGNGR